MNNKPLKFIPEDSEEKFETQRSIRDIPIPTRAERAFLEAEAIKEDEETAYENIAVPGQDRPAKHKNQKGGVIAHKSVEIRVDGIKKPGKGRKKKDGSVHASHPNQYNQPEQISHTILKVEPEDSFNTWEKKHKKGYVFWVLCVLVVIVIFSIVSSLMVSAVVTIVPKKYDIALNSTKLYLGDVPYKTITASVTDNLAVPAKGTVQVDRKASGSVVLYNSYSSTAQKLVENTRLETSDGKVFRLNSAVTIPGSKTVSGKKTPGSITAGITADKSGDDYNVGFKDFKIIAYKGTDKYDQIYARSKTAVDNGYTGTVPNIAQTDISSSTTNLKTKLYQKLIATIQKDSSGYNNYVFIPDSVIIEYKPITQKSSKDGLTVTLSGTVNATAVLYDKAELSKQILKTENVIGESSTTSTSKIKYTGDVSKITVHFPKDTLVSDLNSSKRVYFTVTGTSTLYSMINEEIIIQAISNLGKDQALPVVQELVDAESALISVWPWWISTLPAKSHIKVDIQ